MIADRYNEVKIGIPLYILLDSCDDWVKFCEDAGIDPYCMKEEKVDSGDSLFVTIGTLRKHGVLK